LKAIILDFDGLILDTETPLFTSWKEVCEGYGVSMEPAWWANLLTSQADPPEAYAYLEGKASVGIDREQVRRIRAARELELIAGQTILPGVADVISQAKALSLRVGVASNSERAWVTGHLARLGLLDDFDAIRCRDEVARAKPMPDSYLAVLEALEAAPTEAIAFEDSPVGVAAAKAAGVFCVAVPNPVTRRLEFPSADILVSSLAQVSVAQLILAAEEAQTGSKPLGPAG
jgi:HAD superfamily hydrolase (TIGR01509 family)